jgi:transposase
MQLAPIRAVAARPLLPDLLPTDMRSRRRPRQYGRRLPRQELKPSTLPPIVWRGLVTAWMERERRRAAAVQLGSGEIWKAQLPGPSAAAIEWLRSLPGEVRAVYEAGSTGFELARAARAAGVELMVCAPGAIARQPRDRIKADTRDALKLARLHGAGQLRPVVVPAPELEALRDLVHAREDLRGDLMSARHRIGKLLLRRGLWAGPGETWSDRHLLWLSKVRFTEPLLEVVFGEYLAHHEVLLARRKRLDQLIAEQSVQGSWAPSVARLRCLRGIDTLTAVGLVAEIGEISAFSHPAGQLPRPGPIGAVIRDQAPAGLDHQSRLRPRPQTARRGGLALSPPAQHLVDAQAPPERSAAVRSRPRGAHSCAGIVAGHLDVARAKKRATVAVAVARELACFVWEIATQPD